MSDSFTQEIHKYALESDDNLIVFVRTARSFDKLRKNLISGFAKKLEEKLKETYPSNNGWIINERMLIENPLGTTYPKLAVQKTGWPPKLSVAIEAGKSCKDVDYGVFWEKEPQRTNPGIRNGIYAFMGERFHSNKKLNHGHGIKIVQGLMIGLKKMRLLRCAKL